MRIQDYMKRQWMKPRIRKVYGALWQCEGAGRSAISVSPALAYQKWVYDGQLYPQHPPVYPDWPPFVPAQPTTPCDPWQPLWTVTSNSARIQ